MKRNFLILLCLVFPGVAISQSGDFPFGRIAFKELEMKSYAADTSAEAVVLNEYGYAWINARQNIVFEYHTKIKILKPDGQGRGDFRVQLFKSGTREEIWSSLEAVTFSLVNSSIKQTKFDLKNLITEKTDKYFNVIKFALPDVRVGSVIEVKYVTESPFLFNFHTWEFQDYIPKVTSQYWCEIPVNWVYNITLRGFQKLDKNEITSKEECYEVPGIAAKAPCILTKYAMNQVPAFKKEKYMTTASNYMSAIYYEIAEFQDFEGIKTKYSEEWKDVDARLREHEKFGLQIRKAKNAMADLISPIIKNEPDQLKQAKLIYDFVKGWYTWNGENGMYADLEVKKAYDQRKGNAADINFALIGALQSANLMADPVLVATRDFGIPNKVHPQRSGFNYVIARLKINDQQYLLDATDDFHPFGMLPIRCLNDQGRLVSKEESGWVDLKTTQRQKSTVNMNLTLGTDGTLMGEMVLQYAGYEALDERTELGKSSMEEYQSNLKKKLSGIEIENFEVQNKDSLTKPLIQKMKVKMTELSASNASTIYFNPFIMERYESNPFKSEDRLYPVDLGAPMESVYYASIALPEGWKVEEAPSNKSFSLPNSGGRFLMNVTVEEHRIVLASNLLLAKSIYTSGEYHYLKEFFARVVEAQQSQFVFKKIK